MLLVLVIFGHYHKNRSMYKNFNNAINFYEEVKMLAIGVLGRIAG